MCIPVYGNNFQFFHTFIDSKIRETLLTRISKEVFDILLIMYLLLVLFYRILFKVEKLYNHFVKYL